MANIYPPHDHTTPDQGSTLAVSSDTDTGYGSTITSCSSSDSGPDAPDSDSQAKSIRWHDFAALAGTVSSLKLKFDWTASGSVSIEQDVAGSGSALIRLKVEYSTNSGGAWTEAVNESVSVSGGTSSDTLDESGSEEITLSTSQDLTTVQVRARADATTSATAPASGTVSSTASITTTVSDIQIEAVYPQSIIVMM